MRKNYVLFSNYDLTELKNDVKEYWFDTYAEEMNEEEVLDKVYEMVEDDFVDFKFRFKDYMKGKTFLLFGRIGRWDGDRYGGDIINNFEGIMKYLQDCDYIEFKFKNNHFMIKGSHHDGTVNYELKELNNRGERYIARVSDMSYEDIKKLIKSDYSRLIRFEY